MRTPGIGRNRHEFGQKKCPEPHEEIHVDLDKKGPDLKSSCLPEIFSFFIQTSQICFLSYFVMILAKVGLLFATLNRPLS